MERKNNKLFLLLIGLATLILAFLAVVTGLKLRRYKPVAPTVPQATPRAEVQERSPVAACTLTFNLVSTPTPTPTSTPGSSPTPTPSVTPTPTPTPTPTATPTVTPTPTATPLITPSPTATPQVPVTPQAGVAWPTILMVLGGILLLTLGFAL